MKKAIWFSRHQPTAAQLDDAQKMGVEIVAVAEGMTLGARTMETEPDVWSVAGEIDSLLTTHGTRTVFGVIPVPLRAHWHAQTERPEVWEAWNVSRTPEGGKPTFVHRSWVRTM